jgi:hypothetical protein
MSQPLLEGGPDESVRLRREIAGLEQELQVAKDEAAKFKQLSKDAAHAVRVLRTLTEPWLNALKALHGEMSRVDAEALGGAEDNISGPNRSIWQERIAKATPAEGRILQTLLDGGGTMTLAQIRKAAKTFGNTSTYLNRLLAKNWVQKTAHGSWALKEL